MTDRLSKIAHIGCTNWQHTINRCSSVVRRHWKAHASKVVRQDQRRRDRAVEPEEAWQDWVYFANAYTMRAMNELRKEDE